MTDEFSHPLEGDLAARLIRAGTEEAPPARSLVRTLSALGFGASTLGTATAVGAIGTAKGAGALTLGALGKWAGIGVASGIAVAGASLGARQLAEPSLKAQPRAAEQSVPMTPRGVSPPSVPREPPVVTTASVSKPTIAAPAAAAPSATLAEPGAPLAAEVAFVDRGRAAFQRGEFPAALSALAGYERAFPEARLLPEVLYLRMRALGDGGQAERALELARRLVREFPRNPHAASARMVLDGSGP